MNTPIQIVRATMTSLAEHPKHGVDFAFVVDALGAVLVDAERYKALKIVHESCARDYAICELKHVEFVAVNEPIDQLADRLREDFR